MNDNTEEVMQAASISAEQARAEGHSDPMGETLSEATDVANMRLDLTKDEKRRCVALMLGIRYYTDTIIKDSRYLELMIAREEKMKFSNDPDRELWHLRPASENGVIGCALMFEQFLLGNHTPIASIQIGDREIRPDSDRAQGNVAETE